MGAGTRDGGGSRAEYSFHASNISSSVQGQPRNSHTGLERLTRYSKLNQQRKHPSRHPVSGTNCPSERGGLPGGQEALRGHAESVHGPPTADALLCSAQLTTSRQDRWKNCV